MGWKNPKKHANVTTPKEMFGEASDELVGACISLALAIGGGLLIGQNKGKTALSIKLYEPDAINPPVYCNSLEEAHSTFQELYDYLASHPNRPKP